MPRYEIDSGLLAEYVSRSAFEMRFPSSIRALKILCCEIRPLQFLSMRGLDRAADDLSLAFGERIFVRRSGQAAVGGFPVVAARDIARAIAVLRARLGDSVASVLDVGLLGLGITIIHPLNDGNGRLCRLAWCHGLMSLGLDSAAIAKGLDVFLADGGFPAWQTLRTASLGNESPFVQRWMAAFGEG